MTGRQNGADTVSTQLGECLKAARQARKLTLKQVAERTGLSLSTLSKVENHQMSLTYDKLLQLTNGLGIAIAELFHSAADRGPPAAQMVTARRSISRAKDGDVIDTRTYSYAYKCTDLMSKAMVPITGELRARTLAEFGPLIRHPGEEYVYVTAGRVEVHTEYYAPEILETGDSLYIDSSMGHAYLNAGEDPARIVCVCTAESPDLYQQLRQMALREA
ncbi:XRE family transcriptional regulator [Azorhizobium sp. AG788]|uniref:helix-turn-helix domain-containing protein n=1 Tax=Azorhizobium sp. AG788 TaxID=2183897 RepID=UPI0010616406|nr:XRE family transcriptional regulator [Azorhizobium sp. AG788]TDT99222.1 XRE family transcriptional regulator [Azorhizobium sp. AG788]